MFLFGLSLGHNGIDTVFGDLNKNPSNRRADPIE